MNLCPDKHDTKTYILITHGFMRPRVMKTVIFTRKNVDIVITSCPCTYRWLLFWRSLNKFGAKTNLRETAAFSGWRLFYARTYTYYNRACVFSRKHKHERFPEARCSVIAFESTQKPQRIRENPRGFSARSPLLVRRKRPDDDPTRYNIIIICSPRPLRLREGDFDDDDGNNNIITVTVVCYRTI